MNLELSIANTERDVTEWSSLKQLAKIFTQVTGWYFNRCQAGLTSDINRLTNYANLMKITIMNISLNKSIPSIRPEFIRNKPHTTQNTKSTFKSTNENTKIRPSSLSIHLMHLIKVL